MRSSIRAVAPVALGLTFLVAACEEEPPPPPFALHPVSWSDLPGWQEDRVAEALPALRRSCARIEGKPASAAKGPIAEAGSVGQWQAACAALDDVAAGDEQAARAYLRQWFAPHAVRGDGKDEGLFTGYYEIEMAAAREPDGNYREPLYGPPADLVTADLGVFRDDLRGMRLIGRVEDRRLVPYHTREAIESGVLDGNAPVLYWADDPVNVLLLHIQGSGRLHLKDGTLVRIGFAGSNGQPFVGIGRTLLDEGRIAPDKASMPEIAAWLRANPDEARALINRNPRYIFFREIEGEGPIGAQGVPLTPKRSLAVDTSLIPLGAPVWLDTVDPDGRPLRRLMVAQDTGAAIKGAVRGDFFWGAGDEAFRMAGRMKSRGRYFLLLPKAVEVKAALAKGTAAPHP